MKLNYTVKENFDGKNLLTVLRKEMNLSATCVRRLKAVRGITLNGKHSYVTVPVHTGDSVSVDLALSEPESDIVPEKGNVSVLWENEGLVAVNKPCGMLVHPSHARYTGTLSNFVAQYLIDNGCDGTCHAVNRLDRDTSGVVLFAKNSHFKDLAGCALASAEKEYVAVCCGFPASESGTIDLPIRRLAERELRRIVSPDGQRAVTHYRLERSAVIGGHKLSLVRFVLETGRTHQIRVHSLACGFPILGDKLYGTESSFSAAEALGVSAQALHAERLSFTDPVIHGKVTVSAPIEREDINEIILKIYEN